MILKANSPFHLKNRNQKTILSLMLCTVLIGLFLLSSFSFSTSSMVPLQPFMETFETNGPYINEAIFGVYHGSDSQWAALVDGLIDVGNAPLTLDERNDIEFNEWEVNQFWGIACSTHFDPFFVQELEGPPGFNGFPFNYVSLRRAVAIALNKYAIAQLAFGENGVALDHIIPASFSAWHEPDLGVDYRDGDIQRAIEILEAAGFIDFNLDGYRDAPNATEVTLSLYYTPTELASKYIQHSKIATNTTLIAQTIRVTMEALGFRINLYPVSETTLWAYTHIGYRAYQMALIPLEIYNRAPEYLQNLFYSYTIPVVDSPTTETLLYSSNIMNFHNTTVDTLIETMNSTTDYDAYQEALSQLQVAIAQNQPLIPLCTQYEYTAQRTDRYERWFNQPGIGAANQWSLLQSRLKTGQPEKHPITDVGGTMDIGINEVPATLNPILATLPDTWLVLDSIYSRLVRMNPITGELVPDLAQSWTIEPVGNELRIIFNLQNNASWHDGEPFTADDVAFTYNYTNNLPGPWPLNRPKPYIPISSIEVLNNVTIAITTSLNGYFAIFDLSESVILPQHLWEGILQPAYFDNPRPTGTGPFMFDKRPEPGLIYLSYFPDYHYGIPGSRELPVFIDYSFLLWLGGGIFVVALTIIGAIWFLRRTPHGFT
jgi:ABC-type transport system substrate-binding protein